MEEKDLAVLSAAVYAYLNQEELRSEAYVSTVPTAFFQRNITQKRNKWRWSLFPQISQKGHRSYQWSTPLEM